MTKERNGERKKEGHARTKEGKKERHNELTKYLTNERTRKKEGHNETNERGT